jgi:16S rRNA (adenine1518-N6/adenine1519-N6)-dimethyltransferase
MPRPNVDSAVIKLTRHKNPPVTVSDEKLMFDIIRASFNQRRKTLVNGLNNAVELKINKENVVNALNQMGLPETIRGEALTLVQFAQLTELLNYQNLQVENT